MEIKNQNIEEFLNDLSSQKPTPGGGAGSALAGAMAAGLIGKVARLTKDNPEVSKIAKKADNFQKQLLELSEKDCQAYDEVVKAYRLPKDFGHLNHRREAIQEALKQAAEVPMETAKRSLEVLRLASFVASEGNQNAVSDARCAIELATAAIYGALENVRINLSLITDKKLVEDLRDEIDEILAEEKLKTG